MPGDAIALALAGRPFARLGVVPAVPPGARGSYALVIELVEPVELRVGALGVHAFPSGQYVYCGSALGGLAARLARHLRSAKRRHWHIDYLLEAARVVDVWACAAPERLECRLAAHLSALPGAATPVSGFGSSDCRCPSHLVRIAAATSVCPAGAVRPGPGQP